MALEEYRAPTKVKLAALWASTMFCYIYCDYFGLYVAGTVNEMIMTLAIAFIALRWPREPRGG